VNSGTYIEKRSHCERVVKLFPSNVVKTECLQNRAISIGVADKMLIGV